MRHLHWALGLVILPVSDQEKKKCWENQSGILLPAWNPTSDCLSQPKWGRKATACSIEKEMGTKEAGKGWALRPGFQTWPCYSWFSSVSPYTKLGITEPALNTDYILKWYLVKSECIVDLRVIITSLLVNNKQTVGRNDSACTVIVRGVCRYTRIHVL